MYKVNRKAISKTTLKVNQAEIGETIETKVQRITQNKEPITDGATPIYTERKDGVLPEYNPRTDKWEIMAEAMDASSKRHIDRRFKKNTPQDNTPAAQAASDKRGDAGGEPLQTTDSK